MGVLETIASVLNCFVELLAQATYILLSANYNFMTVLIGCAVELLNNICSVVEATVNLFHCYLIDFCTFVKEFVTMMMLVISYIAYVIQSLYIMFLSLFSSLFDIVQFLLSAVHIFGASVCRVMNFTAIVLVYASKLIFRAVILLLMFFPNIFLCLYNILLRGAVGIFYYLLTFLHHFKYLIIDTAYTIKVESANMLHSIPPKAYIGLLILIVLYYKRKPVVHCSVKCFNLLTSFLRDAARTVWSFIYVSFSYVLSLIMNPFLWVLQLISRNLPSLTRSGNPQQSGRSCFSVISNKLSFRGVFHKILSHPKSVDVNLNNSDQDEHLRYLEQKLNEERDRHLCIICQDEVRTMLLLPCRHLCLCTHCWQSLQNQSTACPVCRRDVYEAFPVYV